MTDRAWVAVAAAAALACSGAGCIVTKTTYEMKAKEADSLRDALASLNREKTRVEGENAVLSKQAAAGKEAEADLSARLKEKDETLKRLTEDLASARQTFEGSRVTREQFISELLEKEKATGKRLQELSARAEAAERDLERMKKEGEARDREVAELRKALEAAVPASRERDILAGRLERLQEERRDAGKARDGRLAGLSADLRKLSPEISVFPMGPALRVVAPARLVLVQKGGPLTKLGAAMVSQVAGAVAEIPSASLVVITGETASSETLRAAAAKGNIPEGRLYSLVRNQERQAELLLVAP